MPFDYDLFVIGGGSGGVRAARQAAATGAKVALAEEDRMGGTCVIRGCVPKKIMVFASGYPQQIEDARAYGWDVGTPVFDWHRFRDNLHAELDRLEQVYRKLLDGSGVEIYDARATLQDAHTLSLSTGEVVTAKHILVATGGRPVKPDIENADIGMTSNEIFLMEDLPQSMLIIGGGYIACEFAGILNGLGVQVTQFYRGDQILRGFDNEAREAVATQMRARGVNILVHTEIASLQRDDSTGQVRVTTQAGEDMTFDAVFFATGRRPNTDGLGLSEAGVMLGRGGEIVVDAYSQTAIPSIYAIGDVTDRVQLTPVAIREAMAFVETVFRGNPTAMDYALIASAVFTQPELGSIGLTEEAAAARGPIEVYSTSFKPMQQFFAGRDDRVLMKLVVSQEDRKILGCHIVADQAGEMIQLAAIAIGMGATKDDFDRTVAVHPTMAEELVTMRSATRRTESSTLGNAAETADDSAPLAPVRTA